MPVSDEPIAVPQASAEDTEAAPTFALALRRAERVLTPDCLGSTRLGSMTATLHQDALMVATNAVNTIAPILGPTAIAGGIWTIPWLANMAAVNAASPLAPGTGLFNLLRQPRATAAAGGPSGGRGLLDSFAFTTLTERDSAGKVRTQREFDAGTLAATLVKWGVGAPADVNLMAASGNLTALLQDDQITIVEGYEIRELGTLTIGSLPGTLPPFTWGSVSVFGGLTPPLLTVTVTGIAGTVNFASLGGGPLITSATVGPSGNILAGFALPAVTLVARITRAETPFANTLLSFGTLGGCFAFPLICPMIVTLVTLVFFVSNNITAVTATAPALGLTYDITFAFDNTTNRVEPFVSLISQTGTAIVTTTWTTPNIIANLLNSLIAAIGNAFNTWTTLLSSQVAASVQALLRQQGIQLPLAGRQNELTATSGTAISTAGSLLQLFADIEPVDDVASFPYTTQVPTSSVIGLRLLTAHLRMRSDLNPQIPPPPGPGPALTVGTFAGLGLSQNALNYYVFEQWLNGLFEVTISDPTTISAFVSQTPQLFSRIPSVIHIWPAGPPRIEIVTVEVAHGALRPLLVCFDDVRICFEGPVRVGHTDNTVSAGLWELSCNFKLPGTVQLAWPWVFSILLDDSRRTPADFEPRTWEFVDLNSPMVMSQIQAVSVAKIVDLAASLIAAAQSASSLQRPPNVHNWQRNLPATQQDVLKPIVPPAPLVPQQVYLEILTYQKALCAIGAVDTALLSLFDGSGAAALNLILGLAAAPGPLPTTASGMTAAQGIALRRFLLPFLGLSFGP